MTTQKSVYLRVTMENPSGQDANLTPEGIRRGVEVSISDSFEFLCSCEVSLANPPHTELEDVRSFHTKFGVPMASRPAFLSEDLEEFRTKFMQEELDEFTEACSLGDMEKAGDALVDLVYVALGTALMMGLPWPELWTEVQRANMAKRRAQSASESKRGHATDVVKPEGWVGPNHLPALLQASLPHAVTTRSWPVLTADGYLVSLMPSGCLASGAGLKGSEL